MSKFKKDTQKILLDQLCFLKSGVTESENSTDFPKYWYPITQHLRAFDPDVVLVVGDRGTGKSALFKAVFENKLLPFLEPFDPIRRLPYKDTQHLNWVAHSFSDQDFAGHKAIKTVMKSSGKEIDFWFAYLVRKLHQYLQDSPFDKLVNIPGADTDAILQTFDQLANKPLIALDNLDQKLLKEDSWIFIGYDELDTLGGADWDAMTGAVRGLISFWSNYSRRWRRIRSKIFLRSDLFRRHSSVGGADLAKLAANRVELTWSDKNLFSMLIKRIANTSDDLYNYCKSAKIPFKKDKDPIFGYIPDLSDAEDARPFIERIIGKYMGAGNRKGQSFTWVLDHLRDSKKIVTPRLLVRLFEITAGKERDNPGAKGPNLFRPASLRRALDDISNDHVTQAHSEWPWLDGIKKRIREDKLVPWSRKELQKLLAKNWEDSWSDSKPDIKPPAADSREFIDYLVELGIFRERSEDRIDVPDIYLSGLGLIRKGGVKRK